jgi:hypothetical protein
VPRRLGAVTNDGLGIRALCPRLASAGSDKRDEEPCNLHASESRDLINDARFYLLYERIGEHVACSPATPASVWHRGAQALYRTVQDGIGLQTGPARRGSRSMGT